MNRESVKKNIDIISAFAEGKVIQISNEKGEWIDMTERDGLPMGTLEEEPNIFRIKPEPKYRPFANAEECWKEMLKHQPFGWVKTDSGYEPIWYVNEDDDFNATFKYSTFADGTPFGVKTGE